MKSRLPEIVTFVAAILFVEIAMDLGVLQPVVSKGRWSGGPRQQQPKDSPSLKLEVSSTPPSSTGSLAEKLGSNLRGEEGSREKKHRKKGKEKAVKHEVEIEEEIEADGQPDPEKPMKPEVEIEEEIEADGQPDPEKPVKPEVEIEEEIEADGQPDPHPKAEVEEELVEAGGGLELSIGPSASPLPSEGEEKEEEGEVGAGRVTKCHSKCGERGTCNEDLGRCDCPNNLAGEDCSVPAMPRCQVSVEPEVWLPCHSGVTCGCAMDCELQGLHHSNTCYDYSDSRTDVQTGEMGQKYMASTLLHFDSDGKGHMEYRVPVAEDADIRWPRKGRVPASRCPGNCRGRGVCFEQDNASFCYCPAMYYATPDCSLFEPTQPYGMPFMCVNGCSGKGECVSGFCRCEPGFWGIDCRLFRTRDGTTGVLPVPPFRWSSDVPAPPPEAASPRPRIYVYELPPKFNVWLFHHQDLLDWQECLYLSERLLASPFRHADPETADYFYVPGWFRFHSDQDQHIERVMSYVIDTWPYWNRTQGHNHIIFAGDDWGACEFGHPMGFRKPYFHNMTVFTLWSYTLNMYKGKRDPCFINGVDLALPPRLEPQSLRDSPPINAWSAGIVRKAGGIVGPSELKDPPLPEGWEEEFFQGSQRDVLFYFVGNPADHIPEGEPDRRVRTDDDLKTYSFSLNARQLAFKHFEHANVSGFMLVRTGGPNFYQMPTDYNKQMLKTKFCFAPAGFGWAMRTTQSILRGCIPVIVQPNVTQAFEGELLDWNELSIRLSLEDIPRLPQILGNITASEITRKRAAMVKVWPRFVWNSASFQDMGGPGQGAIPADISLGAIATLMAAQDPVASAMTVLASRLAKAEKKAN